MNSDESIFLEEIAAAPRSVDRRLIYADWLEEHGDPRSEFIRLWHKLDVLQPWTGDYVESLARMRQAQDGIDSSWLKRLGYTVQYRPMLSEIPRDRPSRWRLLTAFLAAWHRSPQESDRISVSVIRSCERLMELTLPAALTEWYCHSGYLDDVWRNASSTDSRARLYEPTDLWPYRERDQLLIGGLPGGAVEYALRVSELGQDDPPVYYVGPTLVSTRLSVSEFAIYRAVAVTIRASAKTPGWRAHVANPARYVPADFEAIDLGDVPHPDGSTRFYEGPDVLIEVHPSGLVVTALNAKSAAPVLEHIPMRQLRLRIDGEWQPTQDERRYVSGVSDPNLLED